MSGETSLTDERLERLIAEEEQTFRGLAARLAREYGVSARDLYQEGRVTAQQYGRRYDPSRGSFARFIFKYVQGAMLDLCVKAAQAGGRAWAMVMASSSYLDSVSGGDFFLEDDEMRKKRHDEGRYAVAANAVLSLLKPTVASPERAVLTAQIWKIVHPALKALEPRKRELIERTVLGDETVSAVAEELKVSRSTAHRLVHEALASIGRRLGGREQVGEMLEEFRP